MTDNFRSNAFSDNRGRRGGYGPAVLDTGAGSWNQPWEVVAAPAPPPAPPAWGQPYYGAGYWLEPWRHGWDFDRGGPYAGRGPRNYQRSDERIFEDVNERLTWNPSLDATDIDIVVNSGEVTLNGDVGSRWEKRLAEDIADSVPGVRDVHNRLKVRRGGVTG
jgi:hypothetical protein